MVCDFEGNTFIISQAKSFLRLKLFLEQGIFNLLLKPLFSEATEIAPGTVVCALHAGGPSLLSSTTYLYYQHDHLRL